jgi:hypothetical protein
MLKFTFIRLGQWKQTGFIVAGRELRDRALGHRLTKLRHKYLNINRHESSSDDEGGVPRQRQKPKDKTSNQLPESDESDVEKELQTLRLELRMVARAARQMMLGKLGLRASSGFV